MNLQKLLKPKQVSEVLGVDVHTLAVWRCTNRVSLPYVKSGRLVMYREQDVERFIESRVHGEVKAAA